MEGRITIAALLVSGAIILHSIQGLYETYVLFRAIDACVEYGGSRESCYIQMLER